MVPFNRSLSVSGNENASVSAPKAEEEPLFDRDEIAGVDTLLSSPKNQRNVLGTQTSNNSPINYSHKMLSPNDSIEKQSSPRLHKNSVARIMAKENLEKSVSKQKEDNAAYEAAIKDGTMQK